jgi:hypothetical protein
LRQRQLRFLRVRAAAAGLDLNRFNDDDALGVSEAEALFVRGFEDFSQMLDKSCRAGILISLPLDGGGLGRG